MIDKIKCRFGLHKFGQIKQMVIEDKIVMAKRCKSCGKIEIVPYGKMKN